jgi:predicted DNA-binding transcriptional regulator YafY
LVEDYRTNLTGLTPEEVRALFMLNIPAPLDQLGVGRELRGAMLKLAAALPVSQRPDEERARQRIYLDSSGWFQAEESVPYLQAIQQALWSDKKLLIRYRSDFEAEIERTIDPYGLVAKASVWYLVYGWESYVRVVRVGRVMGVELLEETFSRPADFDLAVFWKEWCREFEQGRPYFPVTARVSPALLPYLTEVFGRRNQYIQTQQGIPDTEGWVTVTLPFETFDAARDRLLGFGGALEVLVPEALRLSLHDFAQQINKIYARSS